MNRKNKGNYEPFIAEGSIADLCIKGFHKLRKFLKRDSFPDKVNEIRKMMEAFKPAAICNDERDYQLNLYGYLSAIFPQVSIETQTGSSRPDITIDDIAIEIKGPTTTSGLQTIADKILRYGEHYKYMFIVLFELDVTDEYWKELKNGINRYHKDRVIIIEE